MEKLSMCRICLAEGIRMHMIATTHLQEVYENLTKMPLKTNDSRPVKVCYICCARLQNCYKLRRSCLQSEMLFEEMLRRKAAKPQKIYKESSSRTLQVVHPLITIDVLETLQSNYCFMEKSTEMEYDIKIEPADIEDEREKENMIDMERDIKSLGPKWDDMAMQDIKNEFEDIQTTIKAEIDEEISYSTTAGNFRPQPQENCIVSVEIIKGEVSHVDTSTPCSTLASEATLRCQTAGSSRDFKQTENEDIKFDKNVNNIKITNKPIVKCLGTNAVTDGRNSKSNVINQNASGKKIKQFPCDTCQKCFSRKIDLARHFRTHTGERPFSCNVCNKRFIQKKTLEIHSRVHTGEKPYKCEICKKSFIQNSHLSSHIRIHTGEKPHQCNVCDKSFIQKGDLNKHIRIHTGERPYQCNVCHRCFIQKSDFRKHSRMHTGEKPYKCKVCEKAFSRKDNLEQHVRTHGSMNAELTESQFLTHAKYRFSVQL